MSDQFVAEIRIFPFNFPPTGWAFCKGQLHADLAEHGPVLAARHHLRRRRQIDLRFAQHAGQCADAAGPGPGLSLRDPRRDVGRRIDDPADHRKYRCTPIPLSDAERPTPTTTPPPANIRPRAPGTPARRRRQRRSTATSRAGNAAMTPQALEPGGRRPAAQQHAALSDAQFLHRPAGHLPAAAVSRANRGQPSRPIIKGSENVRTLPLRDQGHLLQLPAQGLGALQRPAPADQPEPGLFSLLGTTYGGNGQTNFALPDLRGRVPIHFGGAHDLGEAAGTTSVTINIQQLPTHTHQLQGARRQSSRRAMPDRRGRTASSTPAIGFAPGRQTVRAQHLRATPGNLITLHAEAVQQRRRQPAAQQHDALSDAQLHRRAPGHLPQPQLAGAPKGGARGGRSGSDRVPFIVRGRPSR